MDPLETLRSRHEAITAHWRAIVAGAQAIGTEARDLSSVGVLISGKGATFGILRMPVYASGAYVADIVSHPDAEGLAFNFAEVCPTWVQRLITDPTSHPLAY